MGVIEYIKRKYQEGKAKKQAKQQAEQERYTYSPERAEQLKTAKAMYRRQQEFEKEKMAFEAQMRRQAYEKSITGRVGKKFRQITTKQIPYQKEGKIYYRTELRGRAPVSVGTSQAIARAVGQRLPSRYQGKKGYRGRGRPRGPSGRYIIPGKGSVGVYEYRKWLRYQKRMAIMQQQAQMSQMMAKNPRLARYYAETGQLPQPAQEMPQRMPIQRQGQATITKPMSYPAQINTQESAGVSMVGGWDLMRMKMPSFNLNEQSPETNIPMKVFQVDSPVTNPQGDYYTEPDFITGKQILKRRMGDMFPAW